MDSFRVSRYYFLWVKHECGWCQKALELLNRKAVSHTVFTCDGHPELLAEAKNNFNWQTVPIVFEVCSDGTAKLIGGFTDLEDHLKGVENDSMYTITNKPM